MECYVLRRCLEQITHLLLCQPDRLALEAALDTRLPIGGLIKQELAV